MKEDQIIHHFIFQTKFGYSVIFYKKSPFLLTRIVLPKTNNKNKQQNYKPHQKAIIISKLIIDYFNGSPVHMIRPSWEWLDAGRLTMLQKSVYSATAKIPYGKLSSYKEIAEAINRPNAYRFVGTTLAKNRFPILIPCHRVVRSNNTIGLFAGGKNLKIKMIELESAQIK
ncbi:MAG: MGMT family protein [Deltaproteobacteria bacterium]|nr:MGMT family protein [Deltaproteobacteria bacterium]MBW1834684.1 MGMT family protein [Deltaproteobacteria bacterium]MBW2164829.1 MGMT family protein [Deltaproteobacteria bacterium]